jgi:hypothetical protein
VRSATGSAVRQPLQQEFVVFDMLDAHPLTFVIVMAAVLVPPFHTLATFVFSGASPRKGVIVGALFLAWGAFMVWFCLANVVAQAGSPLGNLFVPLFWLGPSVLLLLARDWVLSEPLSQRWLVGLQIWRVIGGVFLIEMARGNLPAVFAVPAGVGDIAVALVASIVLWRCRHAARVPVAAVRLVLVLGVIDFACAFFFGFFSTVGPQQIFFPLVRNDTLLFPTGMIPLFLVPYAIFFHTLSWLSLRRSAAGEGTASRWTPARA